VQAVLVGLIGVGLGCLGGTLLIRFFESHPVFQTGSFVIRPLVTLGTFATPAGLVLAATILAGALPAWLATRIDVAKTLRGPE
jgi:ABC-type antimicrobial peptide transport system permease subunit